MISAKAQGSRVEVISERTEFSSTWVNPDGTSTMEQHTGQIRYRDHGLLKDVDLTLERAPDGAVAPRSDAHGLALGRGGAAKGEPLVSVEEGSGRTVTFGAPRKLPEPMLSGSKATYREVAPGVDLVVEARRTGFEQDFILKQRPVGALAWQIPLKTQGLTARAEPDGSVSFVDHRGVVVSALPAPMAWDSTIDPRSGDHAATSPVALSITQRGLGQAVLTIAPDAAWLANPARVYPVTVDPTYASTKGVANFDAFVQEGTTSDQSASTELKAGTYDGSTVARSFLNFPRSSFSPYKIMSASLYLWENWSYSCTVKPVYVHNVVGNASTATRWTSQPAITVSAAGTYTGAKGYNSGCAAGWIAIPMTSLAQGWTTSTATTVTVAIKASETDVYGWKKFASLETSSDPYVSFTYDRKPGAASAPTLSPVTSYQASGDAAAQNYTTDTTPAFTSKASDQDGNTVQIKYEVHTTTAATDTPVTCTTGYVTQNTNATCSIATALSDNKQYYVRAAVYDGYLWNGTWSPWTTLRLGAATPSAPTSISCPAPYLNGTWNDTPPATNLSCTITTAGTGFTAPGYVVYRVDGAAAATTVKVAAPNTATGAQTTSTTITVPKTAGSHSVVAQTQSPGGKLSASVSDSFGYGGTGMSSPAVSPRTTTTGVVKIVAAGPPRGVSTVPTAKLQWRLAGSGNETTGWNDATSAPLAVTDLGSSGVSVAGSWDTRSAATDAAAGITLNSRVPSLLDLQVCLTYTSATQCTWSQQNVSVQRVPHAFGNGFPTASAGPGQVALWTGEFTTSATDVSVPGYSGALSLGRSHDTYAGATDAATGVFGPGWTASLEGPSAGLSGLQVVDSTRRDGTIALIDGDGSALVYSRPGGRRVDANLAGTTGVYTAANEDTLEDGSKLTVTGTGAATQVVVTDGVGIKTTFQVTAAPTSSADVSVMPFTVSDPVDPSDGQGGTIATKFLPDGMNAARVGRIEATHPTGVTCPSSAATSMLDGTFKGCRALTLNYASATTAIGAAFGDYVGQLRSVTMELWDPALSVMTSTEVAHYAYDSTGHLRTVTDPRNNLSTGYTYSGDKLASVTPAGQTAFQLQYTSESTPRLARVQRLLPDGSATSTLASYVYDNVPMSGAGLADLSASAVGHWYQPVVPTRAMAVFGADHPVTDTNGASLSASDWAFAALSYTDDLGYTVNTATYGAGQWLITSSDYDVRGNVIRVLDAGATSAATVGGLDAGQVDQLASVTAYNTGGEAFPNASAYPAGSLVLDTYGPARDALLANGTTAHVRPRTHTDFDQGAPGNGLNPATGTPYALSTTVTVTAYAGAAGAGTDQETEYVTTSGYDPVLAGDASGWLLGAATRTTVKNATVTNADNSTSLVDLTKVTRYDGEGRVIESRQPSSTGDDAGTTRTVYFTVAANATDPVCGGHPEWAGLVCRVAPMAAPSSGPSLPTETVTAFSALLAPSTTQETSGSVSRTTSIAYLADGRVDTTTTSVGSLTGSTPAAGSRMAYHPNTGLPIEVRQLAPGGLAETGNKVVTGYDSWGRPLTYSTVEGGVTETTTSTYDSAGRLAAVSDPVGTTAWTFDGTDAAGNTEHRGLPTSMTVSRAGSAGPLLFAAAYDTGGRLTLQNLPGGISQSTSFDEAGNATGRGYSGPVTDPDLLTTSTDSWLSWAQDLDVLGRVRHEWTPDGAAFTGPDANSNPVADPGDALGYDRSYNYDAAGRLLQVLDRTASTTGIDVTDPAVTGTQAPCVARSYGFDKNGNRVTLGRSTSTSGTCPSSGTAVVRHAYDSADRLTTGPDGTGSYVYDGLGRGTTMPAGDSPNGTGDVTIGYYDTDQIASITQNGVTTTYTLDANGRRKSAVTTGTGAHSLVRHYTDASDNPGWEEDTNSGVTTTTRFVESLGGDLGVSVTAAGDTSVPLATLHGDVVAAVSLPSTGGTATGITGWSDYDEYGNPRDPASTRALTGAAGYGWLGAKQRAASDIGLLLMGARLYNPVTGQFTSVDPMPGGGATALAYPVDPVNQFDLTGNCWGCGWLKRHVKGITAAASIIALVPIPVVQEVAAVVAIVGSGYMARDDIRHHRWVDLTLDVAGMVAGVGDLALSARAARAERVMLRANSEYRGSTSVLRHAHAEYHHAAKAAATAARHARNADRALAGVGTANYGYHRWAD